MQLPADDGDERPPAQAAGFVFDWEEGWGAIGHHDGSSTGWAHHGIAVTRDGRIITFSEEGPEVLILNHDGDLLTSWVADVTEGHGLYVSREGAEEYLWISDTGAKDTLTSDGGYAEVPDVPRGAVVKCTLDGTELFRIEAPDIDLYRNAAFTPAEVAIDERSQGGSGDIWVADAYGQQLVLRFDEHGQLLGTLTGDEGAGRFAHPHSVFIDRRGDSPVLLVADRRNGRVLVYDLDGRWLQGFGEDFFVTPSAFVKRGSYLFVIELDARITILDADNRPVGRIGVSPGRGPGWPNAFLEDGSAVRPTLVPGQLNTPHGAAFDAEGNLYIAEWLIGGRLIRLLNRGAPQTADPLEGLEGGQPLENWRELLG